MKNRTIEEAQRIADEFIDQNPEETAYLIKLKEYGQRRKNKQTMKQILYWSAVVLGIILFILSLKSCGEIQYNQWQETMIKEGEHFTIDHQEFIRTKRNLDSTLLFDIAFNESMVYRFKTCDSLDYNKLFGILSSQLIADNNSIKIGWRWSYYDFCYETAVVYDYPGGREFYPLGEFYLRDTATFYIDMTKEKVKVICQAGEVEFKLKKPFEYYFLTNIYFGGNNAAPKNMNFKYIIYDKGNY